MRDLRYAIRGLWRTPVFTLATVLALGVAIGSNATIFALIDGLWFRPPGVARPAQLSWIFSTTPTEQYGAWSYPEYLALGDGLSSFDGIVAKGGRGTIMPDADGSPELRLVNVVTINFFSALGVKPALGRLFAPGDEASLQAQPGIVLGNAFWRSRFGGDPSIVGRTVRIMRGTPLPVTVLGVLPADFRDVDAAADRDIWMPPQTWMRLSDPKEFEDRSMRWFFVLGVRKASATRASAQAELAAVVRNLAADYPSTNAGRSARLVSDLAYRVERGGTNAAALLGLVLLVVLITCVNVANLLLARGAARTRELAVRSAMGASRIRIVRELMVESAVLGVLGAAAGLAIASWLVRILPAVLGQPPGFRSFLVFHADGRVFLFTLALTVLTTLLFGAAPSLSAARTDVMALIKAGAGATRPQRAGSWLVVAQVAVSMVLLCGAAILARSFLETRRADLGLTRSPVLTAWITNDVPRPASDVALQRLAALPGVTRSALALRAPLSLSGGGYARPMFFPDRPPEPGAGLPEVKFNAVSASYFDVMGTRLVRGRLFTPADERQGELVMLVNEQFARTFFPGRDPVGALVRPGGPDAPLHRIVGVVQNATINDIGEPPEPYFYLPYWRGQYSEATFLVRTAGDAASLAAPVRDTLRRTSSRLEPRRLITMADYIDYSASSYRATATLAGSLGAIGLLLTILGVYGVIAFRTSRRTREIGIRMALGAQSREVLRMVLREGAGVALLGVAIGVPLSLGATRFMASLLFHVSPWDAAALVSAAAVLVSCVCAAAAVPAWRAARVDPSAALRDA